MAKTKGARTLTVLDKESIMTIVWNCEQFRLTNEETLEVLEDKGYQISQSTLTNIKSELRDSFKKRFGEIGTFEFAQEHLLALDEMKELQRQLWKDFNKSQDPMERVRLSAEIRAICKDLVYYYNSTEIVEWVYKYMEENYGEKIRNQELN